LPGDYINTEIYNSLEVLRNNSRDTEEDDFLDMEGMFDKINALSFLFTTFTGRDLIVDDDQNIILELDVSQDGDRKFITNLENIKLPELLGLKLINFYECDEDVENLINENLSSVNNVHLASEGYCVDFNDYLEGLLQLPCLKMIYLDGFIIDSEHIEKLLQINQLQSLNFFS